MIDCGPLPEPSMDVYDALHARMLSYLKYHGINTKEIRGAQITKRLARIYVILNAIILLYDVPGAKYYGKEYELAQLVDLIPHLYCTKQVALLAMTQTSEIYVHPVRTITIKAAYKMAEFPWREGVAVEDLFMQDTMRRMQWRLEGEGDTAVINPNYVTLKGGYQEQVLPEVSEYTNPRVGVNEVDSELVAMTTQFIKAKPFRKIAQQIYESLNQGSIASFQLQREQNIQSMQVVIRDVAKNEVHVATEVLLRYKEDLMVEAFLHCIHDSFRPQEFLLGTQLRDTHPLNPMEIQVYTGIFQTLSVNQETIDQYSMGDKFYLPDAAYTTPAVRKWLLRMRAHPDHIGEKYDTDRKKRSKPVLQVDKDLDDWGCDEHHYRSSVGGSAASSKGKQRKVYNSIRRSMLREENRARTAGTRKTDPFAMVFIDYPKRLKEEMDTAIRAQALARNYDGDKVHRENILRNKQQEWDKMTPDVQQDIPRPVAFDYRSRYGGKNSKRAGTAARITFREGFGDGGHQGEMALVVEDDDDGGISVDEVFAPVARSAKAISAKYMRRVLGMSGGGDGPSNRRDESASRESPGQRTRDDRSGRVSPVTGSDTNSSDGGGGADDRIVLSFGLGGGGLDRDATLSGLDGLDQGASLAEFLQTTCSELGIEGDAKDALIDPATEFFRRKKCDNVKTVAFAIQSIDQLKEDNLEILWPFIRALRRRMGGDILGEDALTGSSSRQPRTKVARDRMNRDCQESWKAARGPNDAKNPARSLIVSGDGLTYTCCVCDKDKKLRLVGPSDVERHIKLEAKRHWKEVLRKRKQSRKGKQRQRGKAGDSGSIGSGDAGSTRKGRMDLSGSRMEPLAGLRQGSAHDVALQALGDDCY